MTVKHNQVLILLILTLSFINDSASTCPGGVAHFGRQYTIVGDRSSFKGFIWGQPSGGSFSLNVVTCNLNCSPVTGYSATKNATHSTLTISSFKPADAGTWSIRDANDASAKPVDVCQLKATNSTCPGGVGLLGTEYTIVGDRSKYTGFVWVRPTDGRYVVTCNPSCSPVAGYRATMNATHSTLTIHSVGVADAGTWKIVDANVVGAIPVGVCQMTTENVSSNTTDTSPLIVSLPTTAGTHTSADSTCPGGVGLLGTEYTIEGDRSNYTGFVWVRPTDGRYVVTCNPSCSPVAGYSATNDTDSTLTIHSVGVIDTGTWKIVDATVVGAIPVGVCQLTTIGSSSSRLSSSTTPRSTTVNVVEGRFPVGAIVGIVISIVIVLAIIVILVILFRAPRGQKGKYILLKVGGLCWCRK
ncbi:uncharacterized protein LOC124122840 [Haliotis rufescens]|uniref:uncharacterized protein LOC124122840 n=1 Tax=Haliotis rufescens TaxID=6454 RepID=UPI00201F44C1|nr:uncharacterized protein LOC124122840 [Haliotis rufescens]XP_048257948.1 uncharacterized protein LOC124122840 [Haliotis rufescens]